MDAPAPLVDEATMLAAVRANAPGPVLDGHRRLPAAAGRVVAKDVCCPRDVPAAPTATMDGQAARTLDLPGTLPVAGQAMAGAPLAGDVPAGHCVAIATGAWVPAGLDIVIPREETTVTAGKATLPAPAGRPACIRPAGSELAAGAVAVKAGTLLGPRQLALLAGLGIDRVATWRRPRVGVLATGDELRQPGAALPPGAIHDANRPMVLALVANHGCEPVDLGVARDDREELTAVLAAAQGSCDAVLSIGGASVGDRDLLRAATATVGEVVAWQVAVRPGKPFILGRLANGVPLFGLPGNPASVYVACAVFVLPALWQMAGRQPAPRLPWAPATAAAAFTSEAGRVDYQRGLLDLDAPGDWLVRPAGAQGSGALPVLAGADCLVRIPAGAAAVTAGERVSALPLAALD